MCGNIIIRIVYIGISLMLHWICKYSIFLHVSSQFVSGLVYIFVKSCSEVIKVM